MADTIAQPADSVADVVARSGRHASEVTLEALAAGALRTDDIMISADVLLAQAQQARDHEYAPLAENFERAAELTALADDDILAVYEALRPMRSTREELDAIAERLASAGAQRNAALIREAADAYAARGCLRVD